MYDSATNRVPIRWDVTLGPTVHVSVEGAKISSRKLRSLIPIYEENSFDEDLVEEGERNLVSYFQRQGYFDVKVTTQTHHEASQITLVYQVERGTRSAVTSVRIIGNRHVSEASLQDQVVVQKKTRFIFIGHGTMSNDLVRRSVDNLTAYYRNAGYQDVLVKPEVKAQQHKVEVTFRIAEGPLTQVQSLNVEGNKTQTMAKLAPKGLNLKPGQPYSQARLDKDRSQIVAAYLNLGYPNATLKSSTKKSRASHRVDVTYVIDEGSHVTISDVADVGQVHTKQVFIAAIPR